METLIAKILDSIARPESFILLAWVLYLISQIKNKDIIIKDFLEIDRDRVTVLSELTTLIKSILFSSKGGA
jgi:hypothetical protein